MKSPWTFLFVAVLCCYAMLSYANPTNRLFYTSKKVVKPEFASDVLSARLKDLDLPVAVRYNEPVRSRIQRYIKQGSTDSEAILGRTAMYFPVFEHYLQLHGLPQALKYLPMVESTLRPHLTSPAGAAGLWQFVPATARAMGLRINGQVDERLDTYRSTEAAVKMLKSLHREFGDWGLALAAYNAGGGRVRQAIRQAGRRTFWGIQAYLPRETQMYVPAFIAAAYIANYYQHHGLTPDQMASDMIDTRVVRSYDRLTFSDIASRCDVTVATLRKLNMGYKTEVIPANESGNYLVLPSRTIPMFLEHLQPQAGTVALVGRGSIRTHYVTVPGDDINTLAALFNCTVEEIMGWNQLRSAEVTVNQPLLVFLSRSGVRP